MRKRWVVFVAGSLFLGCATTPTGRGIAAGDDLEFVITNESASDLEVFLLHESSAKAIGRVDRFDTRTFRVSRKSLAGQRIELQAFDEALHITPTKVMGIASRGARIVGSIDGVASGPFPPELARQVNWRIGNTAAVLQLTWR